MTLILRLGLPDALCVTVLQPVPEKGGSTTPRAARAEAYSRVIGPWCYTVCAGCRDGGLPRFGEAEAEPQGAAHLGHLGHPGRNVDEVDEA